MVWYSHPKERMIHMSVMRVHKNANFTVMSNYHFKEKKMSLKAKGLLSLMLSLPEDWDYSVAGLTTLSKDGKDGVMTALAELEKFGYLTRTRLVNDRGQFDGIEYNIFEHPQEKPIAEKPISANSIQEKPISEKPPQLNTNSIKDLKNKILNILNTKDTELLELYQTYIELRKSTLSLQGLERLVARAKRLSKGNIRIEKEMLDASIRNNWKDIYLPKEQELEMIKKEGLDELRAFYGIE
jgi:hypothetical protein